MIIAEYLVSFLFGLCIGSFLNVCIYRIPVSRSIVLPGSMCTSCETPIRFYDNIPLLSYLLLRGKCRSCEAAISLRYPMVELMAGLFALCAALRFGVSLQGLLVFAFVCTLLVITFIDIDYQIIPDVISLPGIPLAFVAALFMPRVSVWDSLIGLLLGGGSLYAVAWIYHLLTGKEGMGGGDIKLLSMIGAFTGWQGVLFTIFVGSATGSVTGLIVMLHTKKNLKLAVPFGPFLAIGAISYVFFGADLVRWYLRLLQPY